ncbi:hypothetical protein [Streptomyces sp. NPDC008240]|uniref:hypothetical protein n=1 Tax=Streptomyces sp. NPDC008240 TaxID=3364822 RepID=UPI0036EDD71E
MTLAIEIYFGASFALLVLVIWRPRRPRKPALEARITAARQRTGIDEYDGPDSLRLLKDLEAHMKAYAETVADFYDTTTGDNR